MNNKDQAPEVLTARMAAEVRKALIVALDVLSWTEIIEIQIEVAREQGYDLVGCLLEAGLNILNDFYGIEEEGDPT